MEPWTLGVTGANVALRQNREVARVWRRIKRKLRGDRAAIVITGLPGVGKTVLFDHLTGAASKDGYAPPGESIQIETGKRKRKGLRIRMRVIPGQDRWVRQDGLRAISSGQEELSGLLHVVANGYTKIRSEWAGQHISDSETIDSFRAKQRSREIIDLEQTLDRLRENMAHVRRPIWVVIAVNKVDLFSEAPELTEAQAFYTDSSGAFQAAISRFTQTVGSDNVHINVIPVSAWPETFTFGPEEKQARLDRSQQAELLLGLARTLEEHTHAGAG